VLPADMQQFNMQQFNKVSAKPDKISRDDAVAMNAET
jgi:hypothetical protein